MTFAQKITAEYNEDGTGIVVYNQTKNEIYIFEESKNSFVKGKETHCSQEVDIQEVKSIEGCDFFEYSIKDGKKDPRKYYEISSGKKQNILFKNPDSKRSLFVCYEKIDGKISREHAITIREPKKPVTENTENNGESNTTPPVPDTPTQPTQPNQPTQPSGSNTPSKPEKPKEPDKTLDKTVIQIRQEESDIEKIQAEYEKEIVYPQNEIITALKEKQAAIGAAIQQTKEKSELTQWKNKDTLLAKIQTIKDQIEEDSSLFNANHAEFIKNKNAETEKFVYKQKTAIIDEYKKVSFYVQEYEKDVNKMNIPYTNIIIFSAVFLIILVALIFYVRSYFRKKSLKLQAQKTLEHSIRPIEEVEEEHTPNNYSVDLTEIKKQAGQDYYPVSMNDIFDDTAIQTVYIKRKCITDIYHFFSEFLKLSEKTNEIGCFIIGQWEYASPEKNTYNISLEEIIEPGADVVYGEYELDFGVEIGVGLESAIFNMRQKTGKEYVHTSWMHSHPGLGLFLSHHDLNVQAQLSYSEHKNRMLAIVIDSNTEELNMAFFTPKKDGSMNNKTELKKELLLEHLYQWAKRPYSVVSENKNVSDYYESASNNQNSKIESVFFSRAAVIEMDHAIMPDATGLSGYFFGKTSPQSNKDRVFIENFQAVNNEKTTDDESVGCLLVVSEYAYRNIINTYYPIISRYDFFAVYQPKTDLLRLITKDKNNKFPETDANTPFLTLMDMKKWTRKKRI
jgi:hypothetical protein